jgi:hypothetical protein
MRSRQTSSLLFKNKAQISLYKTHKENLSHSRHQ